MRPFVTLEPLPQDQVDDLLILPFYQDQGRCLPAFEESRYVNLSLPLIEQKEFQGNHGEVLIHYQNLIEAKRVMFLGLGQDFSSSCQLQEAFASAISLCKEKGYETLHVILPSKGKQHEKKIVESLLMASYQFAKYKIEKKLKPIKTIRLSDGSDALKKQIHEIEKVCFWIDYLRDRVNENADEKHPCFFAQEIERLARCSPKLSSRILQKKDLEEEKMGLLLAVGKGSCHDPILGILSYQGNPSCPDHTVLVGKGITFDTGGLNLKPTGGMEEMRSDMAGAATVLATVAAACDLALPVNITAVIASAENAIDANSFKPGDVYFSHAGYSVEIGNTDAEGRLVLIDAISYAQKYLKPSRIIDLATLTGGVIVALGDLYAGLFSPDDVLATSLLQASSSSGDPLWRMPFELSYLKDLKSEVADIKNCGSRHGGCIKGALFIHKAVAKGIPWAHLDIAGSAFHAKTSPLYPTQATGYGVRLLLEFFKLHG